MPSATATPSRAGAPMPVGACPRPPPVWKRHTWAPVLASNAYTDGGAVTKIIPSLTTAIAREETVLSSRAVQAAPSFVTFDVVICASVEYRAFPPSPPTAGHSFELSPPDCTAEPPRTATAAATVA